MTTGTVILICLGSFFFIIFLLFWIGRSMFRNSPCEESKDCYYVFYNSGCRFAKDNDIDAKAEASKLIKTGIDWRVRVYNSKTDKLIHDEKIETVFNK